jgi:hypothetical protein
VAVCAGAEALRGTTVCTGAVTEGCAAIGCAGTATGVDKAITAGTEDRTGAASSTEAT